MKTYVKKSQNGRSMIEMLGVLAIVGVLSAGGIAGYSMAMQSYKTNQLIEKVQIISQAARAVYKGNYDDLSPNNLIASGKVKDISNPFGGAFVFAKSSAGQGIFSLNTGGATVPAQACVDILLTDWGNTGMFWGISVQSSNPADSYRREKGNYPLSVTDAISICKGGDKLIHWWFK